jgi:hypothetical protein
LEVFSISIVRVPALLLAGAFVTMAPAAVAADEPPSIKITVRVYQIAGLPAALEQNALVETEALLRTARVEVDWRRCTGAEPRYVEECDVLPGPAELAVRMVRKQASRHRKPVTLGFAQFDRCAGGGVLATVYVDRVASLAKDAGADYAVLLGRVVAHELGHLLMRGAEHPRLGLMRPIWTVAEVRRNRLVDWTFTSDDQAAMHRP